MSWSLRIHNGDLDFNGSSFAIVTGPNKLVQDLKCWILEPRGDDPMHPDYGSLLDGGMLLDRTMINSMLGQPISSIALVTIEAELRRILAGYQAQQQDRISRDSVRYGKNTMSPGEILLSIEKIELSPVADTVFASIFIKTASGDSITFTI